MLTDIPLSQARANLAETLRLVEQQDEPVFISRRGAPVAVLMSPGQYERLRSGASGGFAARLTAWRNAHADALQASADAGDKGNVDDDDFLAGVRDASPGRDFSW